MTELEFFIVLAAVYLLYIFRVLLAGIVVTVLWFLLFLFILFAASPLVYLGTNLIRFLPRLWQILWHIVPTWLGVLERKDHDRAQVFFGTPELRQRVGETSTFKIEVLDKNLSIQDQRSLLDRLKIEISPKSTAFGQFGDYTSNRIPFVKEYHGSEEICTLTITYSVQKSGDYQLCIIDHFRDVIGSPTTVHFDPGDLDAEKTVFQKPSPCILFTANGPSTVFYLRPKDKFGNICKLSPADLAKFDFGVKNTNAQEVDYFKTLQYQFLENLFENSGDSVRFTVYFKQVGFYQGEISFNNLPIQQGKFDLVVMNGSEAATFCQLLAQDTNWIYHEGRLLGTGSHADKDGNGKGSKVYIYVGSKQLSIRQYLLALFPIRVATFRVTPVTKIQVLPQERSSGTDIISISDGLQKVTVRMESSVARRVVAIFSHFITKRTGVSEGSFASKQRLFYRRLVELQTSFRLSMNFLSIQRNDVVNSTMRQTKGFSSKDWYKNFKIDFESEPGVDAGGVRKEWLELLCVELFKPNPSGLFASLGNSRLVHPNPSGSRDSKWTLKHYELAGKVVGKCLFETAIGTSYKQMVNGRFSRSFLAQVVGLRPNYQHFEQDDPELFLQKVKYILENDVETMDLTFTEEEYTTNGQLIKTVDLIPNGSKLKVTDDNKEEYLQELANYKLATRVKDELDAFKNGLHGLVPDELLVNFDENELEILWCGESLFDVEDLKKCFLKGGWSWDPNYSKVLDWFWASVTGFSDEERARLLQFTTGSSLLPHGGFKELNPKFQITLSAEFGKLPVAHTCINEIVLSDNFTFDKFQKCLKTAIDEGNQGFAFR